MEAGADPQTPTPTPPKRGGRWRRKILPGFCIAYAIGAIAFWCGIRYLGEKWWPATILLYAPRWPWLLPIFVLAPLSVRRGKLIWLVLLTGVFVLIPLMGLSIPIARMLHATPSGQKIRLLVCNVHGHELNREAMKKYVLQSQPQVVLMEDYSGQDAMPDLWRNGWHTYRFGQLFLASEFPIRHVQDLHLERITGPDDNDPEHRTGAAGCYDLQTPGGIVHIINLHLSSPHASLREFKRDTNRAIAELEANSTRRWNESQMISQFLSKQTGPMILAGDFNTPAESPIYRHFWSRYADAFPSAGFGFGYTHFFRLSELRIDHLLTNASVICTHCEIGPPCGTPHRPILADLVVTLPPK